MNFDYYYGDESNQFAFYRIPRQLITGEAFKKLSTDAKLLYGLLLDRMGLSAKNGWYDDMGRGLYRLSVPGPGHQRLLLRLHYRVEQRQRANGAARLPGVYSQHRRGTDRRR